MKFSLNSTDNLDFEQCQIKVKVCAGLQLFPPKLQKLGSSNYVSLVC